MSDSMYLIVFITAEIQFILSVYKLRGKQHIYFLIISALLTYSMKFSLKYSTMGAYIILGISTIGFAIGIITWLFLYKLLGYFIESPKWDRRASILATVFFFSVVIFKDPINHLIWFTRILEL